MDTSEILTKIRKIIRSIDIESKKIDREYGVSIPQVLCLSYLHTFENYQSTQGEIRKFLNLNSSTVSGIINRLEIKGYVARLPKIGDKRTVTIALTSAGEKLLTSLPPILHERLLTKLGQLPSEQIERIEESLNILIEFLNIEEVDASPIITISGLPKD